MTALDPVGDFIAACLSRDPAHSETARDCYVAYRDWCAATGIKPYSEKTFATLLPGRGIPLLAGRIRHYCGVRLKASTDPRRGRDLRFPQDGEGRRAAAAPVSAAARVFRWGVSRFASPSSVGFADAFSHKGRRLARGLLVGLAAALGALAVGMVAGAGAAAGFVLLTGGALDVVPAALTLAGAGAMLIGSAKVLFTPAFWITSVTVPGDFHGELSDGELDYE